MVAKFTCLSCDEIFLEKDRTEATYRGKPTSIDICAFCEKGPTSSLVNSHNYKIGYFRTYSKGPNNTWEEIPELDRLEFEALKDEDISEILGGKFGIEFMMATYGVDIPQDAIDNFAECISIMRKVFGTRFNWFKQYEVDARTQSDLHLRAAADPKIEIVRPFELLHQFGSKNVGDSLWKSNFHAEIHSWTNTSFSGILDRTDIEILTKFSRIGRMMTIMWDYLHDSKPEVLQRLEEDIHYDVKEYPHCVGVREATYFSPVALLSVLHVHIVEDIIKSRKDAQQRRSDVDSQNRHIWDSWIDEKTQNKRVTLTLLKCANDDCDHIDKVPIVEESRRQEGWRIITQVGQNKLELSVPLLALSPTCCRPEIFRHTSHGVLGEKKWFLLSNHEFDSSVELSDVCSYTKFRAFPGPSEIEIIRFSEGTPNHDVDWKCPFIKHSSYNEEGAFVFEIMEPDERIQVTVPGLFSGSGYLCSNCYNDD